MSTPHRVSLHEAIMGPGMSPDDVEAREQRALYMQHDRELRTLVYQTWSVCTVVFALVLACCVVYLLLGGDWVRALSGIAISGVLFVLLALSGTRHKRG